MFIPCLFEHSRIHTKLRRRLPLLVQHMQHFLHLHPGALAPPGLQLSDGHEDPRFQVGPADFGF